MIIPRYDPPTPASSQGSSTTILPSHNVISSKQYYYEEIEPERGRSLSRASSGSSRSSGVLVLPSPSSIDSGSQNLRYAYGFPSWTEPPPVQLNTGVRPSGFQIQPHPPAASIITAKLNEMRQTADSALKSSNPELRHSIPPASMSFGSQPPMPYSDSWAQWWAQTAPLVPDMGSPGLFGPRSPVGDYTSIAPTPRPLSTVTERTEPPSAAVAASRPSQILPSVPILAPSDGGRSRSSRSSHSSRSSSAGRSQSTRSIISVEDLPLSDSSRTAPQPPPTIVVPGPRSQHPRIIPQAPTQAPIVINPASAPVSLLSQPIQCSIPSMMTPERRGSRSRSRSPIHLSPPIVRYPTQPPIIIDSGRRTPPPAVIISQRSRSRSRSRSPRSYYPSYRRYSPDVVRQPTQVPIIELGWGEPCSPVIIRRSRSRSHSPRWHGHPSHRGHSSHLARPTQVPAAEWPAPPPPVIVERPSHSRSPSYGRPYRRHSPSPRRHTVIIQPERGPHIHRRYLSRSPVRRSRSRSPYRGPIIIHRRSRSRSRSPHRVRSRTPTGPSYRQGHPARRSRSHGFHEHSPRRHSRSRRVSRSRSPRVIRVHSRHSRSRSRSPVYTPHPASTPRPRSPDDNVLPGSSRRSARTPPIVVIQPSTVTSSTSRSNSPIIIPSNVPPSALPQSWESWGMPPLQDRGLNPGHPYYTPSPPPFIGQGWPNCYPSVPGGAGVPLGYPPQWTGYENSFAAPQAPYGAPPMNPHPPPWAQAPTWANQPSGLPKHPRFFFTDGNAPVIVDNTLYRLHRYLFSKGSWYLNLGEQPNYLWESKKDFDRFLTILYPSDYSKHECETAEEWASVLTVADHVGMQDIRRLAISRLAECAGPVDKIVLGHRYNVTEWLAPAYLALATRTESISAAEGVRLGVDALVRLAALQDEIYGNLRSYVNPEKFAEMFASKLAI